MNCIIANLEETGILGYAIGELASPGDIITLNGELGAGKTTLTQSIAAGLGVKERYITSPSFAILHEYQGRLPLYHFDFYRLNESGEVEEHGFSEYFYRNGLCVIEWAEIGEEFLPQKRLAITLKHDKEKNESRNITIRGDLYRDDFYSLLEEKLRSADIYLQQ